LLIPAALLFAFIKLTSEVLEGETLAFDKAYLRFAVLGMRLIRLVPPGWKQ
jgi:hypothetical protein